MSEGTEYEPFLTWKKDGIATLTKTDGTTMELYVGQTIEFTVDSCIDQDRSRHNDIKVVGRIVQFKSGDVRPWGLIYDILHHGAFISTPSNKNHLGDIHYNAEVWNSIR